MRGVWVQTLVMGALLLGGPLLVANGACLDDLPAALVCPPAPDSPACPRKVVGNQSCPSLDSCFIARRGTCECSAEQSCAGAAAVCFPPPDCPRSVQDVAANARCLDVTATSTDVCTCGCLDCAVRCDGRGVALGNGDKTRFQLSRALGTSGKMRLMFRLRGVGKARIAVLSSIGNEVPLGELAVDGDGYVDVMSSQEASWQSDGERPAVLELAMDDVTSQLEIDCVVPFLIP